MRLCVVDCSFAMSWVFEDERSEVADQLAQRLSERDAIVVPSVLWSLDVRNALRNAVRRGRLTAVEAEQGRQLLAQLPRVTVACPAGLGDTIDRLMRAHDLTSYDAAYLTIAMEFALPLATTDATLAAAAGAAGVTRYQG